MAFFKTDAFDVVRLSSRVVWIGGLQLAPNASGTIGLFDSVNEPEIVLPEGFDPSGDVPLRASVRVHTVPNSAGPLTNLPLSVGKEGETAEGFLITLTNTNVNLVTQVFEVYVELIGDDPDGGGDGSCVTVNINCGH